MKYITLILLVIYLFITHKDLLASEISFSQENQTLFGSIEEIPNSLLGTWRVSSKIISTNSPLTFRKEGIDFWNLSKTNNVMKLCNPFNGASSEITINANKDNHIIFTKKGYYEGKNITDTVEITIKGDYFEGYDTLVLETISDIDSNVIKIEKAKYRVDGEKIFGSAIVGE